MVVTRSKCGDDDDDDDDDFEVPPTVIQKKKVPKKKGKRSKEVQSNASDDEGCMPSTTKPSKLNVVHGVRERENYVKQYRSNIVSLINIMRDTRFTERHISILERTPFGMLFKSFWKKEDVVLKKFKKVDDNVIDENHDELKPISRKEMDLIHNDEEEDALDMEENLETKEDEDHVAEALGDDQPLKDFIDLGKLERVQKENKRLKSENMALVEELKKMRETMQKIQEDQEAKTKEMMEKMSNTEKEMEKLRKEFEVLESEKKQLVEQIEENAVHAATQAFASKEIPHAKGVEQEKNFRIQTALKETPIVVEPLQTSMVKKIKIKARKKKEMSDFECEPREAKKKKTTKQAIEVIK
ncbi:hypothetical protein ACSBR2_032298 [Camellia fascicularis]